MSTSNKTLPTTVAVDAYLDAIADPLRRADCVALRTLMSEVTGHPAVMWGPGIVGFDQYTYSLANGKTAVMCVIGFASRKGDLSVYLVAESPEQSALLARLGRHKMGKACLYLRRLADVDPAVLRALLTASVAETKRRHPV